MHKLLAGVTILEHELSELRLLVERQTGVLLDCPNSALAAHIADYLEAHGLESPTALLDRLRACDQDPATLPQSLEGLLNSNTGFFRHPCAMIALSKEIGRFTSWEPIYCLQQSKSRSAVSTRNRLSRVSPRR